MVSVSLKVNTLPLQKLDEILVDIDVHVPSTGGQRNYVKVTVHLFPAPRAWLQMMQTLLGELLLVL